jgi:hypothetical protein
MQYKISSLYNYFSNIKPMILFMQDIFKLKLKHSIDAFNVGFICHLAAMVGTNSICCEP